MLGGGGGGNLSCWKLNSFSLLNLETWSRAKEVCKIHIFCKIFRAFGAQYVIFTFFRTITVAQRFYPSAKQGPVCLLYTSACKRNT